MSLSCFDRHGTFVCFDQVSEGALEHETSVSTMSSEQDQDADTSVATFSTIHTPNFRFQLDQLAEEPPLATQFHQGLGSQMNRKSMYRKLRKPMGVCDSTLKFERDATGAVATKSETL